MSLAPQLTIDLQELDARRVVVLKGDVDLASAPRVAETLENLIDTDVVLDLRKVDFMDSSGLKLLVTERARFEREGGTLALLVDDNTIVRRLLDMTRLSDGFRIVKTIGELD